MKFELIKRPEMLPIMLAKKEQDRLHFNKVREMIKGGKEGFGFTDFWYNYIPDPFYLDKELKELYHIKKVLQEETEDAEIRINRVYNGLFYVPQLQVGSSSVNLYPDWDVEDPESWETGVYNSAAGIFSVKILRK